MSLYYELTFVCDNCDEEYLIDGNYPSMPPYWIGTQFVIGGSDGTISTREENTPLLHFCCQECLTEYTTSQEFKERCLLADFDEEEETDDGDEPEQDKEEGAS